MRRGLGLGDHNALRQVRHVTSLVSSLQTRRGVSHHKGWFSIAIPEA